MTKVFIQYNSKGTPITVNAYIAEYGFEKNGYEIERFNIHDIDEWETIPLEELKIWQLDKCIFVGGTFALLRIINMLGAGKPKTYNPHIYLPNFCDRNIQESILGQARKRIRNEKPFFLKPYEDTKLFTGFVAKSELDFIKLNSLPDSTKILTSDIINIKSEYRCFVNRKKLVGIQHYSGDCKIGITKFHLIELAIEEFKDQPISYTLDFAILEDNSMQLVEINDGFSLGYCGLHPSIYCQLLEDRWKEIMQIKQKTMFPHSQAELIREKISKENLQLLPEEERYSVYDLEKLLAWQEEYSWVEWEEFKHWQYCDRCGCWTEDQCICYAR